MRKRWIVKKTDNNISNLLAKELSISSVIASLLVNRNISKPEEAHRFLNCNITGLHDPYMLKDMEKAVFRIKRALSKKEKILIYGDYDVDGITSTALLSGVLKNMGAHVFTHIPNRLKEGYGLNMTACEAACKKNISLLISVDCGINAKKEIEYLNKFNIDTIVIDHHKVQSEFLPKSHAIIDPHQDGCTYPFKHLAGVGLVFKTVQALLGSRPEVITGLLDLVALGTVADVAPQLGENRILTRYGLKALNNTKSVGLKELINVSGLKGKEISSGHLGYILGPRINASGRLGSPKMALDLLMTKREDEARDLAVILDQENRNRQKIEGSILREALQKVELEINFKEHRTIVLASSDWHPGVIGIVASRLVDRFYRPTAVISMSESGKGRGSARSISDFNLFRAISECGEHLIEFGGHEAACGFKINEKSIEKFKNLFNSLANKMLHPEHLLPKLNADMDMPLNELSEKLIHDIKRLAPHGPKNPLPVFISRNTKLKSAPRHIGRKGIKFWVTDGKITCEAIAFGVSNKYFDILKDENVDLAYSPSMNRYKGVNSIQLNLEDLRTSGKEAF